MIYLKLFLVFLQVGAFSVGGGYAAIPLISQLVVEEQGWLTMGEFADLITIAEMTPGPIAINSATFVGARLASLPGALAATAGCVAPSLLIVNLLYLIYARYKGAGVFEGVLESLRPAVVALIAAAALNVLRLVVFGEGEISVRSADVFSCCLFAASFFVLRKFKTSPIAVLAACAAVGLISSFFRT